MERVLTLREAAQAALQMQDACNLSGLVHDFPNLLRPVWDEAHRLSQGTDYVNTHPIIVMVISKLCDLTRYTYGSEQDNFKKAYEACKLLAKG